MNKTFFGILAVFIVVIVILINQYYNLRQEESKIRQFNLKYEQYLDKQIYGTSITTIINKAVDDNENASVEKNENGKYIQNDETSVNIELKIHDEEEDKIYAMETIYNGGMDKFVQYYDSILFECTSIKYNSKGRVCYMLFEQITT